MTCCGDATHGCCKPEDKIPVDSLVIATLCDTCRKADVSCPIYPQVTLSCVEYSKFGPLGKQIRPVLVGRMKGGDIVIQANGGHVRIDSENVADLPAAIMLAVSRR